MLFSNKNYVFLFLIYGFSQGGLSAINVCISYFISPFGFTRATDPMILGISLVIFGVAAMFVICRVVFEKKAY